MNDIEMLPELLGDQTLQSLIETFTVAIFLCCGDQVTNAANAHLMAASPKLYKSLESLIGLAKLGAAPIHQYQAAIKEAESVLAEARGDQ